MGKAWTWEDKLKLKIKPDEIIDIVHEVNARHANDELESGFSLSMGVLLNRYAGKRNGAGRMFCVHTRMMCLGDLMKSDDQRLRGYTKEDTTNPACSITHEAIFHATALCPLRTEGSRIWFDPDEFFDIALKNAESEGTA